MNEDKNYNANFLWPYEEDSLESLLYDFANAKTEKYQKEVYKAIKEWNNRPAEKVALDEKLVADEIHKTCLKELNETIGFMLTQKECCLFAKSICARFRPADADKLVEALEELVDLMQGVIEGDYKPDSFTLQPAKQALADWEKGQVKP